MSGREIGVDDQISGDEIVIASQSNIILPQEPIDVHRKPNFVICLHS
jgi:hypothetical protein